MLNTNKMNTKILKSIQYINFLFSLLMMITFFSEVFSIYKNQELYMKIYNISENSSSWSLKSIRNYQIENFLMFLFFLLLVSVSFYSFFNKKKENVAKLSILQFVFLICWALYHFYMYTNNAYDR